MTLRKLFLSNIKKLEPWRILVILKHIKGRRPALYQSNRIIQKRVEKKCFLIIAMSVLLIIIDHHPLFGKTLELAVDVWHPYEDISVKQAPGFSTEVITNVFQSMGVKLNLKEYPWDRGLKNVYKGISDALFTAFPSEERRRHCYYPDEPLAIEKWVLFIRSEEKNNFQFRSYDDLKDKNIGVLRGASVSDLFQTFPCGRLIQGR